MPEPPRPVLNMKGRCVIFIILMGLLVFPQMTVVEKGTSIALEAKGNQIRLEQSKRLPDSSTTKPDEFRIPLTDHAIIADATPASLPAPNITGKSLWTNLYKIGDMTDRLYSVIRVSSGGFAMCGNVYLAGTGRRQEVWLLRADDDGNMLWNYTYGRAGKTDYSYSLIQTADGGFAIAGMIENIVPPYKRNMTLTRVDADGNHLWNRTYGGIADDKANDLVQVDDGGFLMVGSTGSYGPGGQDVWLYRTDANGNHVWNRTYGYADGSDYGNAIIESSSGGFAVAGTIYGDGVGGNMWLLRLDTDGNLDWQKRFGNANVEGAYDILQKSNGNFVLTGSSHNTTTGDGDAWTVLTDSEGNQLWNTTFHYPGGAYGLCISETAAGGFIVSGETWIGSPYGYDSFMFRIDDKGHLLWNSSFSEEWYDYGGDIVSVDDGGFVMTGTRDDEGMLTLVPEPKWIDVPSGFDSEIDIPFCCDLNASSAAEIDSWLVNDTRFLIDSNGIITKGDIESTGYIGLQIWVNDSLDNSIVTDLNFTLIDNIAPAWIEEPEDLIVEYGENFICDIDATDMSGIGTWWLENSDWFRIDAAGIIRAAESLPLGPFGVKVHVNDTEGNTNSALFVVTVEDTTAPTWIYAPHTKILEYGQVLELQLEATDPFGIGSWTVDDTEDFEISQSGMLVSIHILDIGTYPLEVSVSDTNGNGRSEEFDIIVIDTTSPQWLEPPTDVTIEFGESLNCTLIAVDLSGIATWTLNDTVHFSFSNITYEEGSAVSIYNRVELDSGAHGINIIASDMSGNSLCAEFRVFVQEAVTTTPTTTTTTAPTTTTPPPTGNPVVLGLAVTGAGIGIAAVAIILFMRFKHGK